MKLTIIRRLDGMTTLGMTLDLVNELQSLDFGKVVVVIDCQEISDKIQNDSDDTSDYSDSYLRTNIGNMIFQ